MYHFKVNDCTIIDHHLYIALLYQSTISFHHGKTTVKSYSFEKDLFNLAEPYIVDRMKESFGETLVSAASTDQKQTRKRKRSKRKLPSSTQELQAHDWHRPVTEKLKKTFEHIEEKVKEYFASKDVTAAATKTSEEEFDFANFFTLTNYCKSETQSRIASNNSVSPLQIPHRGSSFLIPPFSRFLNSDIRSLNALARDCVENGKYNCILIDPPWENKSVKRGHKYEYLSFSQIKQLPIQKLACHNCLVAVWVTNKRGIQDFVLEELFPSWNVTSISKWFWVKVTTKGVPIYPFDSSHKKPYETLLLGVFKPTSDLGNERVAEENIFCSVPCKIHSHKPPVYNMLEKLSATEESSNPKCLEMFARSLVPNWTSWGNEVLKLQDVSFYEVINCD